jgi:uncharacterized membrane protein YiaA
MLVVEQVVTMVQQHLQLVVAIEAAEQQIEVVALVVIETLMVVKVLLLFVGQFNTKLNHCYKMIEIEIYNVLKNYSKLHTSI